MKTNGYLRLLIAGWLSALVLLASEQHGKVTFGGLPVPGAVVTATQGEKKVTAITDGMGEYSFPDLADGTWNMQVDMSGFSTQKQDVAVGPSGMPSIWEMKLMSLSEIQAQIQPALAETRPAPVASPAAAKPTPPAPAKPKPAAQAVAAAAGRGAAPAAAAAPPPDSAPAELNSQAADGFLVNGSQVNGGASPFALNPAFGNNRRGPRSLYTYQLSFNLGNSALNAKPYSLTGADTPKPSANNFTAQGTVGGPLRIKHLIKNGPNFTVNYNISRSRNANTSTVLVPTLAQRNGDLSNVLSPIVDPTTLMPFLNNVIPANRISLQAQKLLAYYPVPNAVSGILNYQIPIVPSTHSDGVNITMNKSIGRKNSIQGRFAITRSGGKTPTVFGFLDTNSGLGINLGPQWRRQWTTRLSTTFTLSFSRNAQHSYSFFENKTNVSGLAGITGNNQNPTYWGPPGLSFGTSGILGLSDSVPSFNRPQTLSIGAPTSWTHGRHNVQFGADFIRQQFNNFSQSNPRGTFGFTGAATAATPGGGSDFADFLLGIPDQSQLAFGNADKYLRASTYDAFVTDDWRVNSALTLNIGARWDYAAPVTEKYGRLVNLDIAPGFTAAAPVIGYNPTGPVTGMGYPSSLVHPDKHEFEPGIGLAWRPISGSSTVVRAGYSLRYTPSVYQQIAGQMDQQSPLSTSFSVSNSTADPLTLANGFNASPNITKNTFAIDPNFKIGYAQNWNVSIQKDLPAGMGMVVTYIGIKGTRMVQEFYPNTYAPLAANPCPSCPVGFLYETSNGNSTRHAGSIQLRRRLHAGFLAQATYTYAKAIDDTPNGAAQNWLNLAGERGLSSFDQRQNLSNASLQYTSGMGIGGGSLISGWKAAALKEWTIVTPVTWGTGLPVSPNYNGISLGGTGTSGPLRPNFTGAPLYAAPAGLYINPAALGAPAAGQYGNAARDSITGPYQFSLQASLQRTFRVNDRTTLTFRLDTVNPINHPVVSSFNTTYNSPQLGSVLNYTQMRRMTAVFQFRF
jgi:hypothetical protein